MPWLFQDSQCICDYYRQFKHFLQADKGTLAILFLGCRLVVQAEVKECDIPGTEYLQCSCFVFTSTIYQIPPWQSPAVLQMRELCWHFHTGILQDAVLSHLDQFSCMNSLDAVLLICACSSGFRLSHFMFVASSMSSYTVSLYCVMVAKNLVLHGCSWENSCSGNIFCHSFFC